MKKGAGGEEKEIGREERIGRPTGLGEGSPGDGERKEEGTRESSILLARQKYGSSLPLSDTGTSIDSPRVIPIEESPESRPRLAPRKIGIRKVTGNLADVPRVEGNFQARRKERGPKYSEVLAREEGPRRRRRKRRVDLSLLEQSDDL